MNLYQAKPKTTKSSFVRTKMDSINDRFWIYYDDIFVVLEKIYTYEYVGYRCFNLTQNKEFYITEIHHDEFVKL